MVVYGGCYQNGSISSEIIGLDLDYLDWSRINYKQAFDPLTQVECASVIYQRKNNETVRLSDTVLDGIYFFGGKNAKGELQNKLRYLKPTLQEGKVITCEWQKIK